MILVGIFKFYVAYFTELYPLLPCSFDFLYQVYTGVNKIIVSKKIDLSEISF